MFSRTRILFQAVQQLDAVSQQHLQRAQDLPKPLLKFFTKYPPAVLLSQGPTPPITSTTASKSPSKPNASNTESVAPARPDRRTQSFINPDLEQPANLSPNPTKRFNPFLPSRNKATSKWRSPHFSLRQQAVLCKLAHRYGVEDLLPYSPKKISVKEEKRRELGLRVKGTGVGQRVKGKAWERGLKGKLEMRRKAMLRMKGMVEEWKQRGHGRGWKKWPSAKTSKNMNMFQ